MLKPDFFANLDRRQTFRVDLITCPIFRKLIKAIISVRSL